MKKFALYTAIFGNAGRFNIPKVSISNVDKICYTNLGIEEGCNQMIPIRKGKFKQNNFYDIRKRDPILPSPVRQQRFVKICIPDEIFDNYEYSVYVDCKRESVIDFEWLLSFMEPQSDFVTRQHKTRYCIYEEGKVCIDKNKDDKTTILKQLDFYRSEFYPPNNGLHYSYILLRRHTRGLKRFSELWWEQIEKYSFRDQISLPYVAWKHGMKISICPRN